MPNWTRNELVFRGPDDQLSNICAQLGGQNGLVDFNRIAPMPEALRTVVSPVRFGENGRVMVGGGEPYSTREASEDEHDAWVEAGGGSWYEWACANWGTKWNACQVDEHWEIGSGCCSISFLTAWDAPRAFYRSLKAKLADVAPDVTFRVDLIHEDGDEEETLNF